MSWTRLSLKDLNLRLYLSTWTNVAYELSIERISEYTDREVFFIDFHTACWTNATLNINGLWAKNITVWGINVSAWTITANSWYLVKYSSLLDKFVIVWWGNWGGWSPWSVFINWTRQEQTFNHTIPSSDVCLLTETPIDENAIFVFKKDSWLSWFNTVDYTYNETTNVVKLNTPLTYPQEVLIKYMIQQSSFEPIEQTPNTSWIYGWIPQKPLMVYKNWLYMHENIDYSFSWTTLTFVEPTRLTDTIIFIM